MTNTEASKSATKERGRTPNRCEVTMADARCGTVWSKSGTIKGKGATRAMGADHSVGAAPLSSVCHESLAREYASHVERSQPKPACTTLHHQRAYPGAIQVPGHRRDEDISFIMEDDSTTHAVSAHVVDAEEETRLRRENEAYRQMLDETPIAEVIEPGEVDLARETVRQGSTNFTCGTKRKTWWALVAFVVVSIAAAGVATVLTLMRSDENNAAVESSSKDVTDLLISVSFDQGASLQTASTPQNNALQWLLSNSHLAEYSEAKKVQRYTLATLYYSTMGEGWVNNTNWLDDGDECGRWWQDLPGGVGDNSLDCTDTGELLKTLKLFYNGLGGSVPPEIGLLSSLNYLSFAGNDISGTVPTEISRLSKLNRLSLDRNYLTGLIPTTIAQMKQLDWLDLVENGFTGTFSCPDFVDVCLISCAEFNNTNCRHL